MRRKRQQLAGAHEYLHEETILKGRIFTYTAFCEIVTKSIRSLSFMLKNRFITIQNRFILQTLTIQPEWMKR